ncbi:MAG: hypothetical protein BGO43_08855 [Gammaproteobacteria bacterium 39-13]|nr:histone deacetylase family protein [Gammaproteobacteria bacterium]OJV94350.1 MAG: hypothetical protein BGO43_08855 [Gammaproteobacteria bacterium 39-13]
MIRFKRMHHIVNPEDRLKLNEVLKIYQGAFPYHPEYAAKIAKLMEKEHHKDFSPILILAEGQKGKVLGFSLIYYFHKFHYAYLDYIASDPKRARHGIGSALYEATREFLLGMKTIGFFMDVPTDDPALVHEGTDLKINRKKLAFYEQYGALPIINTAYEHISHKANGGYFTYLVFDNLKKQKVLKRTILKEIIAKILFIKGGMKEQDPKVQTILRSIKDDPIQFRKLHYLKAPLKPVTPKNRLTLIEVVNTGNAYQIHNLKEKGYVERPVRIDSIEKGLANLNCIFLKPKNFSEKYLRRIHSEKMIRYISEGQKNIKANGLLYPNVFPIRRPENIPQNWDIRMGYYCMDTFTPLTANVYKAAKQAADAALTGAERLLKGSKLTYVLCRPPGHHAERKVFGGFCYFNNAALAADYLSSHGKVVVLDIDHHHGNGTQNIFYERKDVFFISIHADPRFAYPYYAGFADEEGLGKGKGYNKNFPLKAGTNNEAYLHTLSKACNLIKKFKPRFLVVSLGFDIMQGDPTGYFTITQAGMKKIGQMIGQLNLPFLIIQEGGYSKKNLRNGAFSFFDGLSRDL